MKSRNFFIVILMTGLFFTACKKYEEGPMISILPKKARVVNTWKVEKYLVNNVEQDITFFASYTIEYKKDGKYVETWPLGTENGTWEFGDKKETLITKEDNSTTQTELTIIRLKNKELWLQDVDTVLGVLATSEMHLIPN